jgi:hypothetical protein
MPTLTATTKSKEPPADEEPQPNKKMLQHLYLDADLIEKLEDYRFANRMNTRSEAIRRLLRLGLETAAAKKVA